MGMKRLVKEQLLRLGFDVRRVREEDARFERLTHDQWTLEALERELSSDPLLRLFFGYLIAESNVGSTSRLLTDRVAHFFLGENRSFVEIGAWDPVRHSDTYWLEKSHGWTGCQIEPNPTYAAQLREMRNTTVVEAAVVPSANLGHKAYLHGVDDTAFVSTEESEIALATVSIRE